MERNCDHFYKFTHDPSMDKQHAVNILPQYVSVSSPERGRAKVHHLNGQKWVQLKEVEVRIRRSSKNAGLVHVPLSK